MGSQRVEHNLAAKHSTAQTWVGPSLVAQIVKNLPAMPEVWVRSLGWDDPLEKGMATHSSILVGEFHGQRSLMGYSPRSHKESDMAERLTLSLHFQTWVECGDLASCASRIKALALSNFMVRVWDGVSYLDLGSCPDP